MTLPLPNLAKQSFEELRNDAITSIPQYSGKWTNLNPSDPGITIIELLCWIAENSLYRVNKVPDQTYLSFLKLVTGICEKDPDVMLKNMQEQENKAPIDESHKKILEFLSEIYNGNEKSRTEIKSAALEFIESRYRAITEKDFIELSLESTKSEYWSGRKVERATVSTSPENGLVIITVIAEGADEGEKPLVDWVEDYLAARKLVGTRLQVIEPEYTTIELDVEVTSLPGFHEDAVKENLTKAITEFLSPVKGGQDGTGWPFQRPLMYYELAGIIENTSGVKRTEKVLMNGNSAVKIETGGLFQLRKLAVAIINDLPEEEG